METIDYVKSSVDFVDDSAAVGHRLP